LIFIRVIRVIRGQKAFRMASIYLILNQFDFATESFILTNLFPNSFYERASGSDLDNGLSIDRFSGQAPFRRSCSEESIFHTPLIFSASAGPQGRKLRNTRKEILTQRHKAHKEEKLLVSPIIYVYFRGSYGFLKCVQKELLPVF